jgi:hypothetical protein
MRIGGCLSTMALALFVSACGGSVDPDSGHAALAAGAGSSATPAHHQMRTSLMSATGPRHRILIQHDGDFAIFNPGSSRTVATDLAVPTGVLVFAAAGGRVAEGLQTHGGHDERIYSRPLGHGRRRVLVGNTDGGASIVASHGYVYWAGAHAIGRVPIAGGRADRRFRPLPADDTGPVTTAEGLTISDGYLYFSQCLSDRIGRVALSGPAGRAPVQWVVHTDSCPTDLAVGDGYIYWAGIGGPHGGEAIGRASATGQRVQAAWIYMGLPMRIGGPIVYGRRLYWTGWRFGHPKVMHLYQTRAAANKPRPHVVQTIGPVGAVAIYP